MDRTEPIGLSRALGHYFRDLLRGDPVALTVTLIFLALLALLGLFWLKTIRDRKRADEERRRKKKQHDAEADRTYKKMKKSQRQE